MELDIRRNDVKNNKLYENALKELSALKEVKDEDLYLQIDLNQVLCAMKNTFQIITELSNVNYPKSQESNNAVRNYYYKVLNITQNRLTFFMSVLKSPNSIGVKEYLVDIEIAELLDDKINKENIARIAKVIEENLKLHKKIFDNHTNYNNANTNRKFNISESFVASDCERNGCLCIGAKVPYNSSCFNGLELFGGEIDTTVLRPTRKTADLEIMQTRKAFQNSIKSTLRDFAAMVGLNIDDELENAYLSKSELPSE